MIKATADAKVIECESGDNSIRKAAARGIIKRVEECLNWGVDVNYKDNEVDNGWTALHSAAYNGEIEVAKKLLAKGADIEAPTETGATPLYLTSQHLVTMALYSKDKPVDEKESEIEKLYDLIHYLKSSGASTTVTDKEGQNLYSRVLEVPELRKKLFDK
jgi:ankyrin repeat protein